MTPFPWDAAMRFGFGVLRLSSAAFWALTPRELAAAYRAFGGGRGDAPSGHDLAELMEQFPDGR